LKKAMRVVAAAAVLLAGAETGQALAGYAAVAGHAKAGLADAGHAAAEHAMAGHANAGSLIAGRVHAGDAPLVLREKAARPRGGSLRDLINEAEKHVEQGNWERARQTVETLEHRIRKRFWMLQLLGDEEEYETLERDLARLRLAVRERSRMETLMMLAEIGSVLDNIYSL
jgi:hypothetical protein